MQRFIDWLRGLTAKTATIDGTEQVHIDSSGLSQKALLSDIIRYGGGSGTRITTIVDNTNQANIHQRYDGTMWLEVKGQTAGNARGAGAFDWQAVRTGASQVASGANSIAIGRNSTASAADAIAIGQGAYVTVIGAVAIGGGGPMCEGQYSFATGYQNVASAAGSATLGGQYGRATNGAHVVLSSNNTYMNGIGVAQCNVQGLALETVDATSTALRTAHNSATARMVIPATRSCAFIGIVQAMCNVSSSSNFIKAWRIEGVITRDGSNNPNNTRIVGTPTITVIAQDIDGTPTPSTWAIASITADDTNDALAINVTGQTGQTIRWQASLFYSQVGF